MNDFDKELDYILNGVIDGAANDFGVIKAEIKQAVDKHIVGYNIEGWASSHHHYGVEKDVRYEVQEEQRESLWGKEPLPLEDKTE